MSVFVDSVFLGNFGDSGVFRLDLSASGLASIQSIVLEDDNVISGGTGAASGFDLDMIKLSTTLLSSPSQIAFLPGLNAFNFSSAGVVFQSGFLQPFRSGDDASWNQNRLFGTIDSSPDFATTTLGLLDGLNTGEGGSISIGEGGQIGFVLNSPVPTTNLYLYIADAGGGNDSFRLRVASEPTIAARPGITLVGTANDDVIDLVTGAIAGLGIGNDTISSGDGNDRILSGAGNDILNGGNGNDRINAGTGRDRISADPGNDRIILGKGRDVYEVTRGFGTDVIQDFRDRQDRIDLPSNLRFQQLDITQRGNRTTISVGSDQIVVLTNTRSSLITAADFV